MAYFNLRCFKKLLAKYLLIYPFLGLIGLLDLIVGLIVPYKYEDPELPDKDAVLTELTDKKDPTSAYRSVLTSDLVCIEDPNTNIYSEFCNSVEKFSDCDTLGVRELLSIDDEIQPNGKAFKKFTLGNYKWQTYRQVHVHVNNLSNALLANGLKSGDNIVLFAETRPDWIIGALACFRINVPVVTLYSTLGIDALAYAIVETNTSFVITSGEQLSKIQKILPRIPHLTHLIVISDKFTEKKVNEFKRNNSANKLKVFTLNEMQQQGAEQTTEIMFTSPKRDDLAVIMYTSGSTGNPKGVMMSHGNLLTSLKAVISRLGTIKLEKDIYVAYLPLAHVFELCCELGTLLYGIRMGYSSPQTIADNSTAIKKGQKGDLRVLKPTIMAAVPVVLERLSKTVYEKLSQTSWLKQLFFKLAYQQKLTYFRAGRSTRVLDRVLFKRISSAVVGGKLRLMVCGGALLSREVHEFAQACLSPIIQAYGLTETCAGATTQLPNQTETETVGSVVPCCEMRLVDWPDAGYRCTDTPNPRGEVYVGGANVALGYYKMPEKTNEDFKVINGVRYFATGDIGEMLPNGNLRIIDRKKDLVKLSGGEYVSLNKVESILKLLPFVDNCCVVADPLRGNCVGLVCPNHKKILVYLNNDTSVVDQKAVQRIAELSSVSEKSTELSKMLDENPDLLNKLTKETLEHCLAQGLEKFEIPSRLKFVKEIWTPDTGLVTDSLKLKRKEVEAYYKKEIQQLYK